MSGVGALPRVEDQSSQEFTDDHGVTTQARMVREVVPPDQDGVDLLWHGEKRQRRNRLPVAPVHQGEHTSINVPSSDDEDDDDGDDEQFHPSGTEERPLHTEGQTYTFHRHQATRVKPEHVEWLLAHPVLKFERVESAAERARVEIEAEKRRIRSEEARQAGDPQQEQKDDAAKAKAKKGPAGDTSLFSEKGSG